MMQSTLLKVAAICLLVCVASTFAIPDVSDFSPRSSPSTGLQVVRVYGCGFRTYSEVTCMWNNRFPSRISTIVNDGLIYCETPNIDKSFFQTLPQAVPFKIFFDGNQADLSVELGDFLFGPTVDTFTPSFGYLGGGETLFVSGNGFSEFSSVNVTLDGHTCTNAIIPDDYTIQCTIPPGEFNQDATVDIYFDHNPKFHLHVEGKTYHYGPIFTRINPPCGSVVGGTEVTLIGENLADPALAPDAPPGDLDPIIEVVYQLGDGTILRKNALNVTRNPADKSFLFTTPELDVIDAWGIVVTFDVFFKSLTAQVSIAEPFVYGPIVYSTIDLDSLSQTVNNPFVDGAHVGGGDNLYLEGCGFAFWNTSTLTILDGAGNDACQPGTLELFTDFDNLGEDFLTCVTNDRTACGDSLVSVRFEYEEDISGFRNLPANTVTVGPVIDSSSFFPTRGARTGGTIVTVAGTSFFYTESSSVWSVLVSFTADGGVVVDSVLGTIVSDTEITFITPVGLFDLDVEVSFAFGSGPVNNFDVSCTPEYVGGVQPQFHFGPTCGAVAPPSGHYSGGDVITITGDGFLEDANLVQDTEVRFCIQRLLPVPGFYDTTCVYENVNNNDTFTVSQTQITATTPSYRQNISTIVGNNRLFGDASDVWVHFYAPGGDGLEFPRNQLRPGLEVARILCPTTYFFGPAVNTISPQKGPVGPRASGSPNTQVTITGLAFSDPTALKPNIEVYFNSIGAASAAIHDDHTIYVNTTWANPQDANSDADVLVFFDTCNKTVSNVNLRWGPTIYSLTGPDGVVHTSDHIWGLDYEGGETITVNGEGFSEFTAEGNFLGYCMIRGNPVPTTLVSDTVIECETVETDFGASGPLEVVFGFISDLDENGDWRQVLRATPNLHFTPRIDTINPAFGHTSGGESITITGAGFSASYSSFECFFGHYSNGAYATVNLEGTQVVCTTPSNRAEFNTDVQFYVQVDADAGEIGDKHVLSPSKFHYGPVCSDVQPSSTPLGGLQNVVLIGSGFTDCAPSNSTPFRDCIFNEYRVAFRDPITNKRTFLDASTNKTGSGGNNDNQLKFNAPAGECGYEPIVEIAFYNPLVSTLESTGQFIIKCTNPSRSAFFHYGPVFTSQASDFHQSGVSYGWNGDGVTINGANFKDPAIYTTNDNVNCYVGNQLGRVDFVAGSGTSLRCLVPNGTWNALASIHVEWTGGSKVCTGSHGINAEKFHYGPVIRSSSPSHGYVAGLTPITISGYAFGCCGITSYQCLFPSDATNPNDTIRDQDSVTCSVPANTKIDQQINNLGVGFTSSRFSGQNALTFTEQQTVLRYYYGPVVTGITPQRVSLSGRDEFITITGEGFNDPYFLEAFCDYISITGAKNITPSIPLERTDKTDTTLRCPVPNFARDCGSIDNVRPRWRRIDPAEYRPELKKQYFKTVAPVLAEVDAAPFFSDGGSSSPAYADELNYGPVIVSVCDSNGNCDDDLPVSPISGGLELTITFDNLRDFVDSGSLNDFGPEFGVCAFGSRLAGQISQIDADDLTNGPGTVTCVTPPGSFNFGGKVAVFLNPNANVQTGIEDGWHWLPYIDRVSRNYIHTDGHESVVVTGAGYSEYDSVVCIFDNKRGTQGVITSDYHVTCQTPSNTPKSSIDVRLQFCSFGNVDDNGICDCHYWGTYDTANFTASVPTPLTVLGVTSVAPREGSFCGGTTVTVSGYGFKNFDKIECNWGTTGNIVTPASIVSDVSVVCSTPDYSQRFTSQFAECVEASLFGYRNNRREKISWPISFEVGLPRVTSLSPAVVDYDDYPATIDVFGDYLSGGTIDSGAFFCKIGNNAPLAATLVPITGNSDNGNSARKLVCPTPPKSNLTIGIYAVEIQYPCMAPNFTANRVYLNITQEPTPGTPSPNAVARIGGETISIGGSSLAGGSSYMCSFGTPNVDSNQVFVVATYDSTDNVILCKTPFLPGVNTTTGIDTYISLDGGHSLYKARSRVIYEHITNINDDTCVDDRDRNSASSLSPSLFLFFVLSLLSFFFL